MIPKTVIRPNILYSLIKAIPYSFLAYLVLLVVSWLDSTNYVSDLLIPLSLVYYYYRYSLIRSEVFEIYKEKILYKKGVLSKTTGFLEMYRIRDFKTHRPFYLRLVRAMVVTLVTTDKDMPILQLSGVITSDVMFKIRDLVELQRKNKNVYVTE